MPSPLPQSLLRRLLGLSSISTLLPYMEDTAHTFLGSMLQEYAQESDHSVAHRLALLDTQYPEHAPHDLIVEFLLIKVFSHLFLRLLPTLLAGVWRLEAAGLLYLPQMDD